MSIFCLLLAPLFLLFRLSLTERERRNLSGVFWAFLLGTASTLIHYFAGNYVRPQGFGLSRLAHGLVDLVLVPSCLPFLAAAARGIFTGRGSPRHTGRGGNVPAGRGGGTGTLPVFDGNDDDGGNAGPEKNAAADFRVFAFVWLVPESIFRSLTWSAARNPLYLVLVPLLWTAAAEGISFFAGIFRRGNIRAKILSLFCALALPAVSALAFWFFFRRQTLFGGLALGAALLPAVISVIAAVSAFHRERRFRERLPEGGAQFAARDAPVFAEAVEEPVRKRDK